MKDDDTLTILDEPYTHQPPRDHFGHVMIGCWILFAFAIAGLASAASGTLTESVSVLWKWAVIVTALAMAVWTLSIWLRWRAWARRESYAQRRENRGWSPPWRRPKKLPDPRRSPG